MIKFPPELKRGPKWLRQAFNDLRDAAMRSGIIPEAIIGGYADETPKGLGLVINPAGGRSPVILGFTISDAGDGDDAKYNVSYSTLAGSPPTGMDETGITQEASGNETVWLAVTLAYSGSSYTITDRAVAGGDIMPDDTDTVFHAALGIVRVNDDGKSVVCVNGGFGPVAISVTRCRDWTVVEGKAGDYATNVVFTFASYVG